MSFRSNLSPFLTSTNGAFESLSNWTRASFIASTLSALAKIIEAFALKPTLIKVLSCFFRMPSISNCMAPFSKFPLGAI